MGQRTRKTKSNNSASNHVGTRQRDKAVQGGNDAQMDRNLGGVAHRYGRIGVSVGAGPTRTLFTAKAELADAPILSGGDFGFRVEGTQNGRAVGTLMVRVKGQWVEAGFSGSINRVND
jgi:hypothetical protein